MPYHMMKIRVPWKMQSRLYKELSTKQDKGTGWVHLEARERSIRFDGSTSLTTARIARLPWNRAPRPMKDRSD